MRTEVRVAAGKVSTITLLRVVSGIHNAPSGLFINERKTANEQVKEEKSASQII